MGGKTSQSTQQVSIPPQVLAQYQSVNAAASQTAQTPFQQYSGQFVAPVNSEQTSGINATNEYAQSAQPAYGAAEGLTAASAEQVNPTQLSGADINQYMSPYIGDVLSTTNALTNQNNSIAQSGALGTAINSGAFGGDRTGIAAANLNQQNQLAEQATDAGILNTGYQTALSTAQQQQGVGLSAAQANRAALQSSGAQLGSLAGEQQSSALSGANAQIAAGTVQQQTQQAQDTALYNQFEQQQSYPFQVDQFLANIAEGTGALSGSTTTTTQPGGFFSDERLKYDVKKIGKTFDGQSIVSYKMKGDPRTRIGLIAQDVEKKHPKAVGVAAGFKTVDYEKATDQAAHRGHFKHGGLARQGFAQGGQMYDLSGVLGAQQAMYAPILGQSGMSTTGAPRGGTARVPAPTASTPKMITASGGLSRQPTAAENVKTMADLAQSGQTVYKNLHKTTPATQTPSSGVAPSSGSVPADVPAMSDTFYDAGSQQPTTTDLQNIAPSPDGSKRGGRIGRASGGGGWKKGVSGYTDHTRNAGFAVKMPDSAAREAAGLNAHWGTAHENNAPSPEMTARKGLADGGMPYSEPDSPTALGIPDENSHNQLAKAPDLPKQSPTGFQQLMSMGQGMGGMSSMMPTNGISGGGGGASAAGSGADAGSTGLDATDASSFVDDWARGGVVGRRHKDGGGSADAISAASSDRNATVTGDEPDATVDTAPPLQSAAPNTSLDSVKHLALAAGEAYLGDYGGAAGQVYDAYGSARSNNKRGGLVRKGYDSGGSPDDPDDPTQYAPQGVARGVVNRDPSRESLAYTRDPSTPIPHVEPFQPSSGNVSYNPVYGNQKSPSDGVIDPDVAAYTAGNYGPLSDSGATYTPDAIDPDRRKRQAEAAQLKYGDTIAPPSSATAPAPAPKPKRTGVVPASYTAGNSDAGSVGPPTPTIDQSPRGNTSYTGGVGLQAPDAPNPDQPSDTPIQSRTSAAWDKAKSVGSEIAKPENLIPLLTALSAMGTAPTKHLGVALAAGVGAGAQSYYPAREAQADIAQTQAQTGETQARTGEIGAQTQGIRYHNLAQLQSIYAPDKFTILPDPNGPVKTADGNSYRVIAKGSLISGQAGDQNVKYNTLGANGIASAHNAPIAAASTPDAAKAQSDKDIDQIYADGSAAQGQMLNLSEWEKTMAANQGTVLEPGAAQKLRQQAVSWWNTAMNASGHPDLAIDGLADSQMAAKLTTGTAARTENTYNQRSLGALQAFLQATPNTDMSREAALTLIANQHAQNQEAIDRKNYVSEYENEVKKSSGNPAPYNFLARDAVNSFNKEYKPTDYQREADSLHQIMADPAFANIRDKMANGSDDEKQRLSAALDKRYGANFHRYFTGNP